MTTSQGQYDIVIAGQGAAGFAAALYAARYQTKPVVIGETFGGETAIGGSIENYPGYVDIDGFDLMMHFRDQAVKYDVPIVDDKVTRGRRRRGLLRGRDRVQRHVSDADGYPRSGP